MRLTTTMLNCLAALAVLSLAACGGGGSSPDQASPADPQVFTASAGATIGSNGGVEATHNPQVRP